MPKLLLVSTLLLWSQLIMAQTQNGRRPSERPDAGAAGKEQEFDAPDTFGIYTFYASHPGAERVFADTSLADFEKIDPARRLTWSHRHLGYWGSAATSSIYEPTYRQGLDVGLHQYDIYAVEADELSFYRLATPISDLRYSQGGQQNDFLLETKFARNFSDGLQFSLDYRRLSRTAQQAHYPNQNNRNTALTGGIWRHAKNGRYDLFVTVAANTFQQEDNGGIRIQPASGEVFSSPSSAEVFLTMAETRHQHRAYRLDQYFNIGGGTDTIGSPQRMYTLAHSLTYKRSRYKFSNALQPADTSWYNWYHNFLTGDLGTRMFLTHNQLENTFRISTSKLNDSQVKAARTQKNFIEVGLKHRFHQLNDEVQDSTVNNLFLFGRWNMIPNDKLQLRTYAHLGVGDHLGDYRLSGELFMHLGSAAQFGAKAINQLYEPTFLKQNMVLTGHRIWQNDFSKTLETSLIATYAAPRFQFSVTGGYHLLNNMTYYDSTGMARQLGTPVSVLQVLLKKDFSLGRFHLDNQWAFHKSSEPELPLPDIYGSHSLYYRGYWFGNLHVRLGADLRYTTTWKPTYYNPAIGQFILQDRQQVPFYPAIDAFFSFRVTRFRALFKMDNINALWRDDLYYQTPYYAWPSSAFRISIRWILRN